MGLILVPSKKELLGEDDARQGGYDDHTHGIKSSYNNRSHTFDDHTLYVILDSGCNNPL
jgi:hypothetical protein